MLARFHTRWTTQKIPTLMSKFKEGRAVLRKRLALNPLLRLRWM